MKRIYLVDVSSLIFRAFYAVRPLTSPKGVPVNAIYGFLSMLLKLMREEKPDSVVFCYDRKEPSFRKDMFEEYKAHRTDMPEDLVPQIPYIKKIADDLGIPSLEVPGFEADDIIGTLAQIGAKHGYEVFIVSGDKDFAQLLKPHIWIYDTMKNVKIGPAEAKEKWGVHPHQMIDFLSLVGDSSDNIPGVRGIGPKGAQKLLEQYGTLEGIYDNLDEIKGSTHEKLKVDKDNAFLSKKLVTIVTNVPMLDGIENYHLKPAKQQEIRDLLNELNFRGFEKNITELPNWNGVGEKSEPSALEILDAVPAVPEEVRVQADPDFRPFKQNEGNIGMFASRFQRGQEIWGFSHELGLVLADAEKNDLFLVRDEPARIREFLDQTDLRWKGFDLKREWHSFGLKAPQAAWDGQLASYVVKAGESMEWSRAFARALGHEPKTLPSPVERINELIQLEKALDEKLSVNRRIFSEIELPLLPILYKMEVRGVRLDAGMLSEQSAELGTEIADLEKQVHAAAGESFNIGSPKQLAGILFEKLKLPAGKKTKTGYSTDNEVLEGLRDQHPIAGLVLKYRELTKLKSTYVDALPALMKEDQRVHTTFNQVLAVTGRLSSTDPNLQNIPIRTERGARVRRAFVATPGALLMSVDYSQVELRVLAHYSNDPGLIQAFQNDLDIHAATAAEIFSIKIEDVTADQRRTAKAVNFGIAYGQGAFGLAEVLGIPRSEAQAIIKRYFERFKGVKTYIEDTVKVAGEKGFVETLLGRRRYMDELKSQNAMIRKFGERAAINAPIQGTAADLVKKAMIEVDRKAKSDLILQVHDELIFEAKEALLKEEAPLIVQTMESVADLKVPLKVNWAVGPNWDEAHG
jgi:DNA polymerase-1